MFFKVNRSKRDKTFVFVVRQNLKKNITIFDQSTIFIIKKKSIIEQTI